MGTITKIPLALLAPPQENRGDNIPKPTKKSFVLRGNFNPPKFSAGWRILPKTGAKTDPKKCHFLSFFPQFEKIQQFMMRNNERKPAWWLQGTNRCLFRVDATVGSSHFIGVCRCPATQQRQVGTWGRRQSWFRWIKCFGKRSLWNWCFDRRWES